MGGDQQRYQVSLSGGGGGGGGGGGFSIKGSPTKLN